MMKANKTDESTISKTETNPEKPTLIFVYNADGGLFNLAFDVAHKIFSPQTYDCNLCCVTHGAFGMKDEWRQYLKTLPAPVEFLHADEFKAKYKIENAQKLPAIFLLKNGELKLAIDSNRINACRTVNDLTQIINEQTSDNPKI